MREKLTSAISWKNHEKAKGVNCTRIASYPVTATESMAQSGDVGHLQAQTQKISNKGGGGVKILIQKALKLFLKENPSQFDGHSYLQTHGAP